MSTYRERREARAARLREWAEKREQKSAAALERARQLADAIPLGQPILVGHHSEKRARKDQERIRSGMTKGLEHAGKAREMASRADEIDRQADAAIYRDDPDALERLREKLAGLEAKRARMKAINREIRKGAGWSARLTLTAEEVRDLEMAAKYSGHTGYPPYALSNLGGQISAVRKRIAEHAPEERRPLRIQTAVARDEDVCSCCGGSILPGQTVAWSRGHPVTHEVCP